MPKGGMMWIDVNEELPPRNGFYEVTNNPSGPDTFPNVGFAKYDGYGFLIDSIYREPSFWRVYKPSKQRERRYGKQTA